MKNEKYIFANTKKWNLDSFNKSRDHLPGEWFCIHNKKELTIQIIQEIKPKYIFFPHWSWIVPRSILSAVECVCFHMTDVPYGRGGSPLQNLIKRGHKTTKITALRMTEDIDAGPIYMKRDLDLSGSAQDIFERSALIVMEMIKEIALLEPEPIPQVGDPVLFERRTPEMSILPKSGSINDIYDHIRMLDAQTYPHAFIEYGDFILHFTSADISHGDSIKAYVEIKLRTTGENT